MASRFLDSGGFRKLLDSGEYSDLKLVSDGHEFNVHKLVVCTRSRVLTAAIRPPFQESQTGVIDIKGYDAATVKRMLEFLYTGDYNLSPYPDETIPVPGPSNPAGSPSSDPSPTAQDLDLSDDSLHNLQPLVNGSIIDHVRVCAIADYYDIEPLAKLALSKIQIACGREWDGPAFLEATNESLNTSNYGVLHETFATLVAEYLGRLVDMDQLDDVMGVFCAKVLRKCGQKVEALETQLAESTAREQEARDRADDDAARAKRMKEEISRSLKTLSDRKACRNQSCYAEFNCYIEQSSIQQPAFTLRCAKCRCKQ